MDVDVSRNPGTQRENQVVKRQSLSVDCSSKWRVKGGRRKGECAHVQQALPLRESPTGITTFSFCSLHLPCTCTEIICVLLLLQRYCWDNPWYHLTYPGLHSLPLSSPLCTGIICGQVIISEIIPMTYILKSVDHICGDLFQSNGELINSHLVNFDLMVYRSHLVLA